MQSDTETIGADYAREPGAEPPAGPQIPRAGFWAILSAPGKTNGSGTGHATDPSTQWTYPFSEVEKTGVGYNGWTVLAGGRTGTAYNRKEEINTNIGAGADGRLGNGVLHSNLDYDGDGTYEFCLRPIPMDSIVWVELHYFAVGDEHHEECWIDETNGVDGACD